jgi:hypothetical protein
MKKLTRDRVVPTISASVSRLIIGLGPRFFARRTVNTLTPGTKPTEALRDRTSACEDPLGAMRSSRHPAASGASRPEAEARID